MRTKSYLYHVARRDLLAFGQSESASLLNEPPFSAEAEDAAALYDAFTVYGEQSRRDYAQMAETMAYAESNGHYLDHNRMLAFIGL